jgi:tetratricopeptide (TPR) repeat protein
MVAEALDPILDELRRRIAAHPPDRYPVQHATAQFHLGVALANLGDPDAAEHALRKAVALFDPAQLPREHAKARLALGAALRARGEREEASRCFAAAASLFATEGAPLEEGAARFNLGLVQKERSDLEAALRSLSRARVLLDTRETPDRASAAARELASALLESGAPDEATKHARAAVELAERAGESVALAAAYNVLGLALIASGDAGAAEAFRAATGASPRSIRPQAFALAKANLALAYERQGDFKRARLAARQALAVESLPVAVIRLAADVLSRVGADAFGDCLDVLDKESPHAWALVLREEIGRWVAEDEAVRRAEGAAWVDGLLARPGRATALAEAWFSALLELPPAEMESVLRAALRALRPRPDEERTRFVSQTSSAMARFPLPQCTRLRAACNRLAAELGARATWT